MIKEFNLITLQAALGDLPMGGIRYYKNIGSTNDLAITWAGQNALDMSLVIADEQSSGRGRNGRKWYSPAGESLAFSLILRLGKIETRSIGLFSALGALAVAQAIKEIDDSLEPKIKWPNDVLVDNQKVCGILTEASWIGERIESLVIGIGVNVSNRSVLSYDNLNFPATCLENLSHSNIDRLDLLQKILRATKDWRKRMNTVSFMDTWLEKLAFYGEMVSIWSENSQPRAGIITGLDPNGGLCLRDTNGQNFTTHFGEVHLKPMRL
jgi:BirA family biotin operon repressor/biotin-[acetyl-CoA-carboxylase] ligase